MAEALGPVAATAAKLQTDILEKQRERGRNWPKYTGKRSLDLRDWIEKNCEAGEWSTRTGMLYSAYLDCLEPGTWAFKHPPSAKRFTQRLNDLGIGQYRTSAGRMTLGLRLRTVTPAADDI